MSYKYLILLKWLKNRLLECFLCILVSAIVSFFLLFVDYVVISMDVTYIVLWKWSFIVLFGLSTLHSFLWYVNRWKVDHGLAEKWDVKVETVFDALIKFKLLKKEGLERIQHWTTDDFWKHYNIVRMSNEVAKRIQASLQ